MIPAICLGGILILLIVFCIAYHAEIKKYSDFLDDLGMRESSDRYDAENRFGYLGRYQMGNLALQEAGFMNEEGQWTSLANSYGIFSKSDFLQSEEGQDAAVRLCHIKLCEYIRMYDLDQYVGKRFFNVRITRSGLLAACHLVGVKAMKDALQNNEMAYDGNRVPVSEYLELFSGYDISEVWNGGT